MLEPACDAIVAYLQANAINGLPILLPGTRTDDAEKPTQFMAVNVIGSGPATLRTMGQPGNRLFIHQGEAEVIVEVPFGLGEAGIGPYTKTIANLLQWATLPAPTSPQIVRLFTPRTDRGMQDDRNGNYWAKRVVCPFDFYYFA